MKFREISYEDTVADIRSGPQYCWDENYIIWTAKTTAPRGKRVTRLLLDYFKPEDRILDVGFSQGLTIGYTAQVFSNIEGIDVDPVGLKTAKKRLKKLGLNNKLSVYEGKRLPYKDNSFDGVVSNEVFEHVDDPKLFVSELYRVLKPGGKLLITAPNKLYPIECEFHLPFLSYLPRKLAHFYVKISKRGKSYDGVNHPTYKRFKKTICLFFNKRNVKDITFKVISNYDRYYLNDERGAIIPLAAATIRLNEKLSKTVFKPLSNLLSFILTNSTAGWIFICAK